MHHCLTKAMALCRFGHDPLARIPSIRANEDGSTTKDANQACRRDLPRKCFLRSLFRYLSPRQSK